MSSSYMDGTYFELTNDERKKVDKLAKENFLTTRFLSLASDVLHYKSKQEVKNDMVKGGNKYPQIIAATLNFLQYYSRRTVNN